MAEWVRKPLIKWGAWIATSGRSSAGGGSCYPAYQMVHIRGTGGGSDLVDLEVLQIDVAMGQIRKAKPQLYEVGYEVYVKGMSYVELAANLGCHRNTVTGRLNSLHIAVENIISICSEKKVSTNIGNFSR